MRVLHFITSIDTQKGGVTAYLQLLSKKLGKFVELVVVSSISDSPASFENTKVITLSINLLNFHKQFNSILDTEQPDIVHINGIWEIQTWLVQKWAQKRGIKVVLSPHGMLEPYILNRHKWKKELALLLYQKKALKKADIFHSTAITEKNNLLEFGIKQRIEIVPNSVDLGNIQIRDSFKRNSKLLFLSRIHPKKGLEFLFTAISELNKVNIKISLTIVGTGEKEYVEKLKQLSESLNVDNQISFEGEIFGNAKWDFFKSHDIFVLPSHSENFGIVVAEALACGTPVITTKGTPWQELEEYKCGWWIDIGVEPLVETLKVAMQMSGSELYEMGKNGRKLVEEKYSIEMVTKQMIELYNSIL